MIFLSRERVLAKSWNVILIEVCTSRSMRIMQHRHIMFFIERSSKMSQKIMEACEKVLEEIQAQDEVATFVRDIVMFECYEKTFQFKKKYREELSAVTAK